MISAVFGLIGVIVGGLITSGFQLYVGWRDERRATKRARQLVAGELLNNSRILRSIALGVHTQALHVVGAIFSTSAWTENRALLADEVSPDLWDRLVIAYVEMKYAASWASGGARQSLTTEEVARISRAASQLEALRDELIGRQSAGIPVAGNATSEGPVASEALEEAESR